MDLEVYQSKMILKQIGKSSLDLFLKEFTLDIVKKVLKNYK